MKQILFAGLLAAFCAGTAPAIAQSYVIKFAHSLSSTEPAHLAAEYFAKNVGERTMPRGLKVMSSRRWST